MSPLQSRLVRGLEPARTTSIKCEGSNDGLLPPPDDIRLVQMRLLHRMARRFIRRTIRSFVDCDDLVHDALIEVGPSLWKSSGWPMSILVRTMQCRAIDFARREAVAARWRQENAAQIANLRDSRSSVRELLRECSLCLAPVDRLIIRLRCRGYDCAEIAARLHRSHSAIRQRISRMRSIASHDSLDSS